MIKSPNVLVIDVFQLSNVEALTIHHTDPCKCSRKQIKVKLVLLFNNQKIKPKQIHENNKKQSLGFKLRLLQR